MLRHANGRIKSQGKKWSGEDLEPDDNRVLVVTMDSLPDGQLVLLCENECYIHNIFLNNELYRIIQHN